MRHIREMKNYKAVNQVEKVTDVSINPHWLLFFYTGFHFCLFILFLLRMNEHVCDKNGEKTNEQRSVDCKIRADTDV